MTANRHHDADWLADGNALAELGVWAWDLIANDFTWSIELCRIWGVDATTATPSYEALLACVHPDDAAVVKDAIDRACRDGSAFKLEHRVRRADDEIRTIEARGRVTLDARGTPVRVIGTAQDVSERNALSARLIVADRTASIATLAAGVAHEINNPLAPMSANLELIPIELRRLQLVEPAGELAAMLDELRQGVDRIQQIVRGLTTFSRASANDRTALDVARVMAIAIDLVGSELRRRATVVKELAAAPTVLANEAQLAQVFVNLLINAAHAIPELHPDRHTIRIVTRAHAGRAIIEVHDTGRGIPSAVQGRIFDPFFTTKAVGGGTGLGLSICHGIVTSLGGTISVTSEPGRGAIFCVTLPAAESVPATVETVRPRAISTTRRGEVLIVDDEVIFGNSLRRLLSHDHIVTVATSAPDALTAIRSGKRYDIVLCDLMMPDMTGMELHAAILAIAPEQAAQMVFMTGGAFTPASREFLDEMTGRWFEKPCEVQVLRDLVRSHVR